MAEIRTIPMWHVYGGIVPEGGLAGSRVTITFKPDHPTEMPPFMQSEPIGMSTIFPVPYLKSFDHEPDEDELDELFPGWDRG